MLFKINNTCSKTSKLFLKYYAINILSSTFYNDDPGKLSVKISCVAPTLPPAPDLSTVEAFWSAVAILQSHIKPRAVTAAP